MAAIFCFVLFFKLEQYYILLIAYHGTGGYLSVSDGTATPLNKNVYARAMEELGHSVTDCNGKSQIGTL
jgi:hypothetical protein